MVDLAGDFEHVILVKSPGPRPPFLEVVNHVYGREAVVDTEGDSHPPNSTEWTWLYMKLREQPYREQPLVEVTMNEDHSTMFIASDDRMLAEKTAKYLADRTGGHVTE